MKVLPQVVLVVMGVALLHCASAHRVEHVMSISEDDANKWLMEQDDDVLGALVGEWEKHFGEKNGMDVFLETDSESFEDEEEALEAAAEDDESSDMETASVSNPSAHPSKATKAALDAGFEVSGVRAGGAPKGLRAHKKNHHHKHHGHTKHAKSHAAPVVPDVEDLEEEPRDDEIVEKSKNGKKSVLHEVNATPAAERAEHKKAHKKHHSKHHKHAKIADEYDMDESVAGDSEEEEEEKPHNHKHQKKRHHAKPHHHKEDSAQSMDLNELSSAATQGKISCRTVCEMGDGTTSQFQTTPGVGGSSGASAGAGGAGAQSSSGGVGGSAGATGSSGSTGQAAGGTGAGGSAVGSAGGSAGGAPGAPGSQAGGASGVTTDGSGKVTQCFKLCLPQCNKNDLNCFTKCVRVCIAYNHAGQPTMVPQASEEEEE